MFKNYFEKKAYSIYRRYLKATCEKIVVHPGILRYNWRCYYNAVHDAVANKEKELAMVWYMDRNEDCCPCIHFVNITKGKYIDNTIGYWSKHYDYFLIRKVSEPEFDSIPVTFDLYREQMLKKLPWYIRLFTNFAG